MSRERQQVQEGEGAIQPFIGFNILLTVGKTGPRVMRESDADLNSKQ
jgi:hypothetical protein